MERFPRTFSKASRYGLAVGRVMVHEATLLNWQQVQRLIESDFNEAMTVSLETVYGSYLEGSNSALQIESALERFLADEYRFLDEICAGTLVAEFMLLKYDFHNLRVVLKNHHFGGAGGGEPSVWLGTVSVEELREAVEQPQTARVQAYLKDVITGARVGIERGGADPQTVDTMIDRAFLERRLTVAEEERSGLLISFCQAAIDVANLRIILRGIGFGKDADYYQDALAEGGRLLKKELLDLAGEPFSTVAERLLNSRYGRMLTGVVERGEERAGLTTLDRASDEYLLDQVKGFSRVSVGPERIVRYMLARENEVLMLRIIFMGKLHSLSPEVIEARLPLGYLKEPSR